MSSLILHVSLHSNVHQRISIQIWLCTTPRHMHHAVDLVVHEGHIPTIILTVQVNNIMTSYCWLYYVWLYVVHGCYKNLNNYIVNPSLSRKLVWIQSFKAFHFILSYLCCEASERSVLGLFVSNRRCIFDSWSRFTHGYLHAYYAAWPPKWRIATVAMQLTR